MIKATLLDRLRRCKSGQNCMKCPELAGGAAMILHMIAGVLWLLALAFAGVVGLSAKDKDQSVKNNAFILMTALAGLAFMLQVLA
jgi:hypothetical protein